MKILLILFLIYPGSLLGQSCQKRVQELEQELKVEKKKCDIENKKLVNISKYRVEYKKLVDKHDKEIEKRRKKFEERKAKYKKYIDEAVDKLFDDNNKLIKKYKLTKEDVDGIDFSSLQSSKEK